MESPGQSFNDQAQAYAAFRPTYPTLLYEKIQSYAGPQAEHNLAIDIACGSGQAAVELAKRYHKVGPSRFACVPTADSLRMPSSERRTETINWAQDILQVFLYMCTSVQTEI